MGWQVGLDICAALKDLHALGVIHRDIKPSNVVRKYDELRIAKRGTNRSLGILARSGSSRDLSRNSKEGFLRTSQEFSIHSSESVELNTTVQSERKNRFSGSWLGSFRVAVAGKGLKQHDAALGSTSSLHLRSSEMSSSGPRNSNSSTIRQGTTHSDIPRSPVIMSETRSQEYPSSISPMKDSMPKESEPRPPSNERNIKKFTYMLIDLGSAIGKQDAAEEAGANLSLALQTFSDNAFVGTPAYASPESFTNQVVPSLVSKLSHQHVRKL